MRSNHDRSRGAVLALLLAFAMPAGAQAPAADSVFELRGVVIDAAGTPIVSAELLLTIADAQVAASRTDDNGRFVLTTSATGSGALHVRRLGFNAKDLDVTLPADAHRSFTVRLDASPAQLAEVRVAEQADAERGYLHDFYERSRSNSFGHFYDRQAISQSHARHMSDVLRTVPGVRLFLARAGTNTIRVRGCERAPMVWVDGQRVPDAEVDEVTRPDDVAAMEVYVSPAGVPAQFMDRANACGTIVIWTREQ